jgi:glycosyltransferase involved in cell wall biosynthesis
MSIPITVTIITQNEKANIGRCLESVKWADEIVVVDSGSTDGTLEICERYDCKIIKTEWLGFGPTKHLAVEHASHDWIFSIDSDEEVTPELHQQIIDLLASEPKYKSWRIKRSSFYLSKKIKYSGWDSDYPIRLFNKNFGQFNKKPVHESIVVPGERGTLNGPLLHYTYPTVTSHIAKMNRYSDLSAEEAVARGKKSSVTGALLRGATKFLKMYFIKRGFLDGTAGFILAKNSAFGVYLKYLKIWQQTR